MASDKQITFITGSLSLLDLDVSRDDSIAAAARKVESDFGRLDVLVNNAGIMKEEPPTRDHFRTVFETNVFGVVVLTNAALPLLEASKSLKVINVTSGLGFITQKADPNQQYHKKDMGAESAETSAQGILKIVEGKRDAETSKFIT
ncbi:NAD(P)-binding protein [Zopfia rhizophila CBS 207.26]|uniref:NAD(P)-binding protein n=1 Tax=Zopfia rhizophila CBS 207.26 TaxID=1314779 RepID=A0A6A6DTH0_9PEZI|nr:NAD(P)-binding protein [Zopfia rhizophila CBS 207.26]